MMMARSTSAAGDELYRRLQLSLLLRVIIVTFLLGATIIIHLTRTQSFLTLPLIALYILSAATYFITLVSALLLRWSRRLKALAYVHILWEIVFVTSLIYITTGKYESIFSFLYLLAIIIAGILLYRRGAFLAAAAGSLSYGCILAGLEQGIIQDLLGEYAAMGWNNIIYAFLINMSAMFVMAALSSYLTEKLRITGHELQETMRDRDALEALNDDIVHSLSSGVITLDREARITSFNEAAQKITGVNAGRALGTSLIDLFPQLEELDFSQIPGSNPLRKEVLWYNPYGNKCNLEFRITQLKGASGELLGVLVICDEVTEIRRMEEKLRQSDRLAVVGQLAAGIAHEIRTPLASISGSIQVLDSELELDRTGEKLMRIVVRETDRLNSLITDFLLYANPKPRNIEKLRLDNLVPEIVEVYKHRTDIPYGLKWKVEVEPGMQVETDPKMFEQIMWNLVNNAVEAMPEGGLLTIRVSDREEDGRAPLQGDGAAFRLEVEDTGAGIPAECKDKIFDPFFTTREKGTGLGLSMVHRIVEAMEGEIWVEDNDGGGARFVIRLPRTARPRGQGRAGSETETTGAPGGGV